MTINRRRAASSAVSSEKKLGGHSREKDFADCIGGEVIHGTQKGDFKDKLGNLYSIKSGKKWQIFLYNYNRICTSKYLNVIQGCLDAFVEDSKKYFNDRIICITYKEKYVKVHGREIAKGLLNSDIERALGPNEYMQSKKRLQAATEVVRARLEHKEYLWNFLNEAIFNCDEVDLIAIKDTTFNHDNLFKVFAREDVLSVFCDEIFVGSSEAGNVPEDYNVAGQKTLLRYNKSGREKNIAEIEIRNDRHDKYRLVRFNMYSADALNLLLNSPRLRDFHNVNDTVVAYGRAIQLMRL